MSTGSFLSAARFRGGAKVLRARRSRHPLGKAVAAALAGLALACPVPARAVDGTWNVPGSGVWWTSSPQYWVGGVPSQAGDTANFLNAITSDATVNIPYVPVTAGRLVFDDDNNYTITGGSTMSVTLTNPGSTSASIEVGNTFGNGAHRIDTTVYVKAPLTIANASTGTLTFGYLVSGTQPITLTGPGRVRFEGNNRSTLASELDVTRGTLELAAGDPRYLPGGTGAWRVTAGASIVVAGGTAAGQTPAPLGNGIWLAGAGAAGVGGAMRFEGRPFALTGGMMLTDSATLVQAADAGGASGVVDLGGTNGAGALLGSGTLTLSGAADGSALGTGTFSGDGASFRLNVSAGHSGGTVVDHGVLWVGSQGSLATAGLVTVRPGARLQLTRGVGTGTTGSVAPKSVRLAGGTLLGQGDYDPAAFLDPTSTGGTIAIQSLGVPYTAGGANALDFNALPGGADLGLAAASYTLTLGPTFKLTANASSRAFRFGAPGSGTVVVSAPLADVAGKPVGLVQTGGGVLSLYGANTYSGRTVIDGGEVTVQRASALGAGTNTDADGTWVGAGGRLTVVDGVNLAGEKITLAGGTLGGNGTVGGSVVLERDSVIAGTDVKGVISGPWDVNFAARLGYQPLVVLENANTFTGRVTVDGAGVAVQNAAGLGGVKDVRLRSGGIGFNAAGMSVRSLTVDSGKASSWYPLGIESGTVEVRAGTLDLDFAAPVAVRKTTWGRGAFDTTYTGPAPSVTVDGGRLDLIGGFPTKAPTNAARVVVTSGDAQVRLGDGDYYNEIVLNGGRGPSDDGVLYGLGDNSKVSLFGTLTLGAGVSRVTGGRVQVRGAVTGPGGLEVGASDLQFVGGVADYQGPTSVLANGSLSLWSAPLAGTRSVSLEGTLDVKVSGASDRLPDGVPVALRGGVLNVSGAAAGSESVGPVTVERGRSVVQTDGDGKALNLASVSRATGTTLAFVTRQTKGSLGGGGASDPRVTIGAAPPLTNGMIGAWAVVQRHDVPEPSYSVPASDFATYDAVRGVTALGDAGRAASFDTAGPADNVLLTGASPDTIALTADATVNSLAYKAKGYAKTLDLGGRQLTVASGGILANQGMYDPATRITNGRLTAGVTAGPSELFVYDVSNVDANVTDNAAGGPVSLVVAGRYVTTSLGGTNTYTGTTYVHGTLAITAPSAVPAGGALVVAGDQYPGATYRLPARTFVFNYGAVRLEGGEVLGPGASTFPHPSMTASSITITDGGVIGYVDLRGNMPLTVQRGGQLVGDNGLFTGPITVEDGSLIAVGANKPLGAGTVTVRNGGGLAVGTDGLTNPLVMSGGELSGIYGYSAYKGPITVTGDSRLVTQQRVRLPSDTELMRTSGLYLTGAISIGAGVALTKEGPGVLSLEGPVTHASGSALVLSGGQTVVKTDLGAGRAGGGPAAIAVRAGLDSDVSFQSAQRLGSLAVSDDAVARLAAPTVAARTLATQSLSLSGNGTLDIADGALAIDYDAGAASPAGQVRGWVAAARNGGAWNRAGLTSSEAALRPDARAIGFGEASALLGLSGARTAVWRGQVVDASTLLVRTALPGDATLDDAVNFGDLLALAKSYNGANAYWAQGDFDYNGVVNFADLLILAKHYNQTTAGAPVVPGASAEFNAGVAAAFAAAAVPEPTTLGVLAIGGTGLLVRRRRRGD